MTATSRKTYTIEEYLDLERTSDVRHEYVDGTLIAMAGETLRHDDIVLNIVEALRPIARSKGCRLHATNIRTRVRKTRYRYPDIVVSCEVVTNPRQLEQPCFLLEVLSDSTAETDHNAKLEEYTRLESVQVYAIASQTQCRVILYRRDPSGWHVEILESDDGFVIPCLETSLKLEQIYAGITFENTDPDGGS